MQSRLFNRVTRAVIAALVLIAVGGQLAVAAARPEPGARRARRGFNLFAETFVIFLTNRVACGINNLGEVCVDPGNSPIGGGGFWPRGTPDQYIFNSGLQVAGIIAAEAGFEWAGDTTGAYFMDPRGTQQQGEGVTPVYNSLDPADIQNWPVGAVVRDTAIYAQQLIGRNTISQQDLWVRSWDGSPFLLSGRTHPMGVLVETRGLAWNFPTGNEDILYFVFNFYNISASDPAVYAGLDPAVRDDIAAVGRRFQDQVKSVLGVDIPDQGYAVEQTYAAFFMDPDVEDASHNFSTAVLPFSLAVAYKHDWLAPGWDFPADIFGPPFASAPGFVGVKYLKSPADPNTGEEYGLTMFSNTRNSSTGFPDPVGVVQMWRYLSGRINPAAGDNPCTIPSSEIIAKRLCYLDQVDSDTRFYQSSGPFVLEPGKVFTIVVAYVHAAPVASAIQVGTSMRPGIPPQPSALAAGTDTIRSIDRAVGWISHADGSGDEGVSDGVITQDEVATLPRSLLAKSLVAQEVFDKRFLLPSAPESPNFFLIPGENQVTVVWEPSPTETAGDPFYAVASDPTSALFDPNFRQFDVEGYRLYRGRTAGDLKMIAQFDASGTYFRDYTGAVNYGNCAPELGILDDCPVDFDVDPTRVPQESNAGPYNDVELQGDLVQIARGGRVELADGTALILTTPTGSPDTAVTGGNTGKPALTNTGVPFAFVDQGVLSSLTYFYAVTAFDVNSFRSGPSSLESPPVAKRVTPRALATNTKKLAYSVQQVDKDGNPVPAGSPPNLDPETGTFDGNLPPVGASLKIGAAASELLAAGVVTARVDSIQAGYPFGVDSRAFFTLSGDTTVQVTADFEQPEASADVFPTASGTILPYSSDLMSRFGVSFTGPGRGSVEYSLQFTGFERFAHGSAVAANRFGDIGVATGMLLKSRWFDEGGSEPPDPTIVAIADSAHHAGMLTGVGRIFTPEAYRAPTSWVNNLFRGMQYHGTTVFRAADFVMEWGSGGAVTITDVSNGVDVPFNPEIGSSYGFVDPATFVAAGLTGGDLEDDASPADVNVVSYRHFYGVGIMADFWWEITKAPLTETAKIVPLDFNADGTQDGQGIAFLLNGQPWLMEMSSLPAAGTQWHLRSPSGELDESSITCTSDLDQGVSPTDCSGYSWTPGVNQAAVSNLTFQLTVDTAYSVNPTAEADLDKVHTVPDPYYVTNSMEITTNRKVLKWVNLPAQAIIRVYSLSGVLVNVITHNDPAGGGEVSWDLRNRNNQFVASGVYFYHIETPTGQTKIGRFTVVNFAQ